MPLIWEPQSSHSFPNEINQDVLGCDMCYIFWDISYFTLKNNSSGGRYLCPVCPDSLSVKTSALSHLYFKRTRWKEEEKATTYVKNLAYGISQHCFQRQVLIMCNNNKKTLLKNKNHILINIGSLYKHFFQAHWQCDPLWGKSPNMSCMTARKDSKDHQVLKIA